MTDRDPDRTPRPSDDEVEHEAAPVEQPVDDRGGFHDTAPNPHDEAGTAKTATQAGGAFMLAGALWPAVILMIIAVAIILYFVLR